MTDKERILSAIITRIIPGLLYDSATEKSKYVKCYMLNCSDLRKGDLVFANTSIEINDFIVGFVDHIEDDCVVIREIGSNRLCNYYNESFSVINKEKLGYEILEGIQYEIYQKVRKAFVKYTLYCTRFKSISFKGNTCIVQARKVFENDLLFEVSFSFNSKTTIHSIGKLLIENEQQCVQALKRERSDNHDGK